MTRRIEKILERWFILEPPLFQVLCLHELTPNDAMACPLRSGKRRLEYNPSILEKMSDAALEEAVKLEAVRLLLKHPYERFPDGCCMVAAALGSNVTVSDNYVFGHIKVHSPADFSLDKGMFYEWYAMKIQELLPPADLSDGAEADDSKASDEQPDKGTGAEGQSARALQELAELWGEDEMMVCQINNVIESTKDWGTMPGTLQQVLKASLKAKIDWRKVLSGFRASILSSERKLTRMRPNRRTGFANMGSIRRFNTRLLVAVDVSGSVSDKSVSDFYGVVNSAFRYGFESIDVIQFDHGVRAVHNLKKVVKDVAILGRGGTSFQEPIDYAHENGYDGLVMLTDGYAPPPTIPDGFKTGLLWVCENQDCQDHHKSWMETMGRTCVMELG